MESEKVQTGKVADRKRVADAKVVMYAHHRRAAYAASVNDWCDLVEANYYLRATLAALSAPTSHERALNETD